MSDEMSEQVVARLCTCAGFDHPMRDNPSIHALSCRYRIAREKGDMRQRRDQYRAAALKALQGVLAPFTTRVSPHANVTEMADNDGAFVECTVWVPRDKVDE